jgi:exodeoxyribonuclease V beta subunit
MSSEYRIFDAARSELVKGINLVEASAGTGKTYAITMLVLRAVVELAVPFDKILIVTFTKAATEELRLRIRARLAEARDIFAGKAQSAGGPDETLQAWAATIPDRQAALARTHLALADIDRAAIFTIHGFCQRMLAEQALESGQLFEVELLTDIDDVRMEIADDFWRSRIYSLAPLPCGLVTVAFPTPELLLASVAEAKRATCRIEPRVGPLALVLSRLETVMAILGGWWRKNGGGLADRCRHGLDQGHFKKTFSDGCDRWLQALDDFFSGRNATLPERFQLLHRQQLAGELNGQRIRGEEKRAAYLADWPLPDGGVEELLAAAAELLLTLRVELAEKVRAEVADRLARRGNISFDDLISRLSQALRGNQGQTLRRLLGARYEVALIDEFQDTDAAQWQIFSSIFAGGDHALYLIGDPKQSIYKFRGADIHSYFLARQGATRLWTLEKNYRSHPHLVGEVNRLFTSRPRPFYFPPEILDYRPVAAARGEEDAELSRDGRSLAGMVYCTLAEANDDPGGRWSSGRAADVLRGFAVAEISRLLDPLLPVTLTAGEERPLAPHDIAILVRSHRQAEAYRRALTDAGIPAVVGSRESVFHTGECRDLLLLLQALVAPGDIGRLRAALVIPWFGLSGTDLHALNGDEAVLNSYQNRFLDYHQRWRDQGFLAMMSQLLVTEEVLVTLAGGRAAERAIANIFHLLELVQEEESGEHLGSGQVVQWLARMNKSDRGNDNSELLLESDQEAVRIITMHGVKGLEFPVVFCPFLWYRSTRPGGEKYQVTGHDDHQRPVVDLGSDRFAERRDQAVAEQMAEDLRLLYVALTRAKIRCYTMWADVKPHAGVADAFQSALGYLLFPDGALPCREQQARLAALSPRHSIELVTVAGLEVPVAAGPKGPLAELCPRLPSGRSLATDWQLSSYSAMAMQSEYEQEAQAVPNRAGRTVVVPGLPAGAGFGNVVHELLDILPFSALAGNSRDNDLVLRQKCQRYGVAADPVELAKLLEMVVTTPLVPPAGAAGFSLATLDERCCLKEMGFYCHLGRLATSRINEILADEATVVPLGHRVMRGYLSGFVDLVCAAGGRYYILDYKTNFLGETLADYHGDNLTAAMQSHNYGLQYWIYTLVLHRHLRNRQADYRYQDHFGGVMYLFVRGMTPDIPGSGVFTARPDHEKLVALGRAIGGNDGQ